MIIEHTSIDFASETGEFLAEVFSDEVNLVRDFPDEIYPFLSYFVRRLSSQKATNSFLENLGASREELRKLLEGLERSYR